MQHSTRVNVRARRVRIVSRMTSCPPRPPAENARDPAALIGNLKHEGDQPTSEEEAPHPRIRA